MFGPDFFTAYFYSGADGAKLCASARFLITEKDFISEYASLEVKYAIHFTTPYALLPMAVYDESTAHEYLRHSTGYSDGRIKNDRLVALDLVIISQEPTAIQEYTDRHFPGLELSHGIRAILNYGRDHSKAGSSVQSFLLQTGTLYTLAIFKSGLLLLANTVETAYTEDVRYFMLFALEKLKISEERKLFMLGAASENDELQQGLAPYFINAQEWIPKNTNAEGHNSDSPILWPGNETDRCGL